MTAKITALNRYPQKNEPGEELREARLLTGLGMEGNLHQGGEKQLCLLTAEIREWIKAQAQKGLCFERFKENILIEGLPGGTITPGAKLRAGETILRVSKNRKRCHECCGLLSREIPCRLSGCAVFAAVERGGVIRVGDCVCELSAEA